MEIGERKLPFFYALCNWLEFLPYLWGMMKDTNTQDRSFVHKFEHTSPHISMETSAGTLYKDEGVVMVNTVGFSDDRMHGWFETYDKATGGDRYYAEGVLEIEEINSKLTLTGYDGCFSLPDYIEEAVKSQGIAIEL